MMISELFQNMTEIRLSQIRLDYSRSLKVTFKVYLISQKRLIVLYQFLSPVRPIPHTPTSIRQFGNVCKSQKRNKEMYTKMSLLFIPAIKNMEECEITTKDWTARKQWMVDSRTREENVYVTSVAMKSNQNFKKERKILMKIINRNDWLLLYLKNFKNINFIEEACLAS